MKREEILCIIKWNELKQKTLIYFLEFRWKEKNAVYFKQKLLTLKLYWRILRKRKEILNILKRNWRRYSFFRILMKRKIILYILREIEHIKIVYRIRRKRNRILYTLREITYIKPFLKTLNERVKNTAYFNKKLKY